MSDEMKTKTREELHADLVRFKQELERYSRETFHVELPAAQAKPSIDVEPGISVRFKRLHPDAVLPSYAHPGDACMDLVAIDEPSNHSLPPWFYRLGFAMEVPSGYVSLIFLRSSIVKTPQTLANCVAVIDSTYRGEVVLAFNPNGVNDKDLMNREGDYGYYHKGDKIAQMMILPLPKIIPTWVDELSDTDRGTGGFGSTGR